MDEAMAKRSVIRGCEWEEVTENARYSIQHRSRHEKSSLKEMLGE